MNTRIALPLWVASLVWTIALVPVADAQVGPEAWFFEIDADYGDWLQDLWLDSDPLYLPALDVNLDDADITHSWGRRQSPCDNWAHITESPYMGSQSYRAHCEGTGDQRRTEQMILAGWVPDAGDDQRFFSLAFRLKDLPEFVTGGFLGQLHQGGSGRPPFRFRWDYLCPPDSSECGYYIGMGVYHGHQPDEHFVPMGAPLGGGYHGFEVSPDVWYRMVFRISILPDPIYDPCPGTGEVQAWLMDNATGEWIEVGYYAGPLGYNEGSACTFQWKVGIYGNNADTMTQDYDNVAYGKRWYRITKNYLVGYQKTVLDFWFDEGSGNFVRDRSYWWNGGQPGDPYTDYDNDGVIQGAPLWNTSGVAHGGSLRFDGSNYVAVPMDITDFDFGNYLTAGCWFRTTSRPVDNKGLLFIDEFSSTWKVKLYMSDANLSFGVRHTDGSHETINLAFPAGTYADGKWHHALGTFNRFSPDHQRLKLYIDGALVDQIEGADMPVLRGDDRLVVGKYSVDGYFVGDIDEVLVRNYAMTETEVADLYHFYYPAAGVEEESTGDDGFALIGNQPNPVSSTTAIRFAVPTRSRTTVAIFDSSGRLVARPFDSVAEPGEHQVMWDGRGEDGAALVSGVYFVRVESGGSSRAGQVVLMK